MPKRDKFTYGNIIIDPHGDSTSADYYQDPKLDGIALVIADNPEAATKFNGGQNKPMTAKGGSALANRRNALYAVDGAGIKIAPVVNYGELSGYSTHGKTAIYGMTVPKLTEKGKPTNEDILAYYKAIINVLLVAVSEQKKVLSLPILGAGIYGWDPKLAARIIEEAVKTVKTSLTEQSQMPEVTVHDLNNMSELTSDNIPSITLDELGVVDKHALLAEVCHSIKQQYQANPYWQGMQVLLPTVHDTEQEPAISFSPTVIETSQYRPKAWDKLLTSEQSELNALKEQCAKLLADYASGVGNFFKLHWNRHHTGPAKELLHAIREQKDIAGIANLLAREYRHQAEKPDFNPVGSYARRLKTLLCEANKSLDEKICLNPQRGTSVTSDPSETDRKDDSAVLRL